MYSNDMLLTASLRQALLAVAAESIRCGLTATRHVFSLEQHPAPLRVPRASFVTLLRGGQLRGCVGSLEARRALVEDVARNAHAAAFEDPRFPALTPMEFEQVEIHISVLNPPEPMRFSSEDDLLAQLRPQVDGLVLQDGHYRGTFLPSVWEQLPAAEDFWRQLKRKAGLPEDHWSDTLAVQRYTVESVP